MFVDTKDNDMSFLGETRSASQPPGEVDPNVWTANGVD
jgi:hypothetical protein